MEYIKYKNLYVPLDQSLNCYRHLGIKIDKLLYLEFHEFLYVTGIETKRLSDIFLKAYFFLKNNDMNLLRIQKEYKIGMEEFKLFINEIISFNDVSNTSCIENLNAKIFNYEEEIEHPHDFLIFNKIKKLDDFLSKYEINHLKTHIDSLTIGNLNKSTKNNYEDFYRSCKKIINDSTTFYLYHKTSEFNRFKNKPIGKIFFINPHLKLREVFSYCNSGIVCILSTSEFVFLNISFHDPTLELDDKLKKCNF